ncbi:hypothetical protein Fcan01_15665 [Folsomia candida]|uniref:Uncharacterized protein n=1 Tax=Folsomia candida TaxID=158441 RepID=A0A226DZG2_FOLCA|nr:hypothetical protein Fcan01_15665 [Folsomia candida]
MELHRLIRDFIGVVLFASLVLHVIVYIDPAESQGLTQRCRGRITHFGVPGTRCENSCPNPVPRLGECNTGLMCCLTHETVNGAFLIYILAFLVKFAVVGKTKC